MKRVCFAFMALGLAGCISFNETEYPAVSAPSLPKDREIRVQVAGFDAMFTSYTPVYGYSTVVGGDYWYGHHGRYYGGPYMTTVATETYIPQAAPTTMFRDRATETLEKCGFVLQAPNPAYRIEVTFSGPFISDGDYAKVLAWNILTILTADYGTQTWTAKLKLYGVATGKLLLSRDYSQKYEVTVWGPIPIFSPGAASKTKYNAIQSWCLTALTDLSVADAVDFLSKQVK